MILRKISSASLIILFSLCTISSSFCQSALPGLDLLEGKNKIEIPFQYLAGYIILKVKVKGILPLNFIYDTGAEHTIFFEKHITNLLGFEYEDPIQIRGSDINSSILAYISRGIPLAIERAPVVTRDVVVLDENFLNLQEMTGVQIDGILGGSFFRNLIVGIDFKKKKLILWHPDNFNKKLKGYTTHPIEVIDNKPYINCKTQKPNSQEFDLKLLIDTGASLAFLINTNSAAQLTPPEITTPGKLGKGIGGVINGYKGKMKSLEIGEYGFNNILTHFQEVDDEVDPAFYNDRNGLIGTDLLERFDIIINFLNKEIYLKPSSKIQEEFKYNLSGMELIAFGPELNSYIVFDILPGSPAKEADIKVGDIVKKVGFFEADKYTLHQLDKKLSSKVGKEIRIEILRENEILKKSFILRDYLKG